MGVSGRRRATQRVLQGHLASLRAVGDDESDDETKWRAKAMWQRYSIRWEFLTPLAAGVPAGEDIQRKWLAARQPRVKPPGARPLEEIVTEVAGSMLDAGEEKTVEEEQAERLHVFQRARAEAFVQPPGGEQFLAVRYDTIIRGHLKDCARVLSQLYYPKVKGERSMAMRVVNGLYQPPELYWVPIRDREGRPVTEPTGTREQFIHTQTRQGPISAIKVFEVVEGAVLTFDLLVAENAQGQGWITEKDLKQLMMYGGTHGYGPERSRDCGRYTFTMARAEA